jgi:HSP20 family protein
MYQPTMRRTAQKWPSNVLAGEKAYEIQLAAPGRQKSDFTLQVDEGVLTIKATAPEATSENYVRREFVFTEFTRAFRLPDNVNEEEIEATYEQGVLVVTLPKKIEVKKKILVA